MTECDGQRDWTTYYEAVAGKPARETLVHALSLHTKDEPGDGEAWRALDLGAGEGRDTRELLRSGFRVVAVDPHAESRRRVAESIAHADRTRFSFVGSTLEELAGTADTPEIGRGAFRIVNASFTLPFVAPEHFGRVWEWIRSRVAPGGYFAGQFFGLHDSWARIPGRTHLDRTVVQGLFGGLVVRMFDESEKDGHDAEGNPKHWHVYHVVARRRADDPSRAGGAS